MDKKRLEFAPTHEVERRQALANEFLNEVLRLPWAFISDGSRLSDFQEVRTELELAQACYQRYGLELEERHFQMPLYQLLDELESSRRRRDEN